MRPVTAADDSDTIRPDDDPDSGQRDGIVSKRIYDLFVRYRSRKFVFIEPGGNFGDYLIYRGAHKIAAVAGINYRTISHAEYMCGSFGADDVIYVHGGGALNEIWGYDHLFTQYRHAFGQDGATAICGPQSVLSDESVLRDRIFGEMINRTTKVHMFARDPISLEVLKKCAPAWMELGVDHDTALNLSADDLGVSRRAGGYVLYSVRTDREAVPVREKNLLSFWIDPIYRCQDVDHWMLVHNRAGKIVTNRLHSAILGHILGKPTVLLANNYYKNRAVWEYSLRPLGVEWAESIEIPAHARLVNSIPPLRWAIGLHAFQCVLRAFVFGVRGVCHPRVVAHPGLVTTLPGDRRE